MNTPSDKSAVTAFAKSLKEASGSLRALALVTAVLAVYGFLVSDSTWYGWWTIVGILGALQAAQWCARGNAALTEIHLRLLALTIRQNLNDERINS